MTILMKNRRAGAGGSKDDRKTILSIDQIRKMSARIDKEKKEKLRKKHLILLVRKMVMLTMMVRKMTPILT